MSTPSTQKGLPSVAVCGGAGQFGRLLLRHLHRQTAVTVVDPRPLWGCPSDVTHHQADLLRRSTRNLFRRRRFHTVIHIGANTATGRSDHTRFTAAIENYAKLIDYCGRYGCQKLIFLSSANVYGAHPTNSQFLTEEAPLLSADLSALRDMDMMTQTLFWKLPQMETIILRPCNIAGAVGSVFSRYLRRPTTPVVWGFDPMIQTVHEEDVVHAIIKAMNLNCVGVYNLAGPPPVALRKLLAMMNKKVVAIPSILVKPIIRQLNRWGHFDIDPSYLNYLQFVCMVDDTRARQTLQYEPQNDLSACIQAITRWP